MQQAISLSPLPDPNFALEFKDRLIYTETKYTILKRGESYSESIDYVRYGGRKRHRCVGSG